MVMLGMYIMPGEEKVGAPVVGMSAEGWRLWMGKMAQRRDGSRLNGGIRCD